MRLPLLVTFSALCALPAAAQDNRWVTFKTVRDNWGTVEHQIDRATIQQEGSYRVFWTRVFLPVKKQPLAISSGGQLYVVSQKFAVDCAGRRFGTHYIDSTDPNERKRSADLRTVRWDGLDKHPVIARAVCSAGK